MRHGVVKEAIVMGEKNKLDQLDIASLSEEQLKVLKSAEEQMNRNGADVYLIAVKKA
jgi:hypothetical protein